MENAIKTPKKNVVKKSGKYSPFQIGIFIFLIIYLAFIFLPFIWGFFTTFKDRNEFIENLFGLPKTWRWENYKTVLDNFVVVYSGRGKILSFTFADMMGNSVVYAVIATFCTTTTCYLTAYACSFYDYKWSHVMEVFNLFQMSIPIFGALPSSIMVYKFLGLYENFFGIAVIIHLGWTGMHFFIIEACIRGIPKAYAEAATIDGANQIQLFTRVMFPLTINIYSTIFILDFIGVWNAYTTIYIYLKSFPTAAYGLWKFDNDYSGKVTGVWYKLAAGYLIAAPILVIFIIFHKTLMNGISLSEGVKE